MIWNIKNTIPVKLMLLNRYLPSDDLKTRVQRWSRLPSIQQNRDVPTQPTEFIIFPLEEQPNPKIRRLVHNDPRFHEYPLA